MILLARAVVPMGSEPIADGAVLVNENEIVAVGSASELTRREAGPIVDLGEMVLLPGLINAHCHLDYSTLRNAISPNGSFTAWVKRINAIKRSLTSEDYLEAIHRGFRELLRWGTTTVGNIESFPELMAAMPEPPIRTWWFYEMIDIRHRVTTEDVVRGALSFFESQPHSLNNFGLSPHAPYTASRSLYDLANSCAETMRLSLTTHVAESSEERQMFSDASGPLYDFMSALGRSMEDCGGRTPFSRLWQCRAIDHRWLLVHMNELSETDFAILASLPPRQQPTIVHCPGSHFYFRHSPFPLARLRQLGVPIAIATDSLASTNTLSLFEELRRVRSAEPQLTSRELLEMVTLHPARALDEEGRLGVLQTGALADLIALPFDSPQGLASVYDQVVNFQDRVPWVMIDGQIRHHA